jgi:hypothetical protein
MGNSPILFGQPIGWHLPHFVVFTWFNHSFLRWIATVSNGKASRLKSSQLPTEWLQLGSMGSMEINGLAGNSEPETIGFPMKYRVFHGFPVTFPLNQSSDWKTLQWISQRYRHGSRSKLQIARGIGASTDQDLFWYHCPTHFFFSFMKGTLQQNEKNCLCVGDCRSWLPEMPSPKRVGYRIQHFPISNDLVTRIGVQPGTRKWCIISVYFELVTVFQVIIYKYCYNSPRILVCIPIDGFFDDILMDIGIHMYTY